MKGTVNVKMDFFQTARFSLNDKGQLEGTRAECPSLHWLEVREQPGTPEQLKLEGGLPGMKEWAAEGGSLQICI